MAASTEIANRNKAIVSALCKRLALDPSKLSTASIGTNDITSLFSEILKLYGNGVSLKNEAEVMKWVEFASSFPVEAEACRGILKSLNEELARKSVLLGYGLRPSEADVVVYSALHSFVSIFSEADTQNYPNLMRWMDYVQKKEDFGGSLAAVPIAKPDFQHFEEASASNRPSVDSKKNVKSSKEKKEQPDKESSEKETDPSVSILNIQVGLIRKAWKHPSADTLLVEEIDLGDANVRQVVSGLAKYYTPEDLTNRRVVLITNVKPGKLRDVVSAGLVLCASNQDHTVVEPLIPPEGAIIGERISFSGHEGKPEDVLNPKKKQLEKITPHLLTNDKGIATFKGVPFMTSVGPCTSSVPNASIK